MVFTSGTPLRLEEGYELYIKSVDIDGNKAYLELIRDGFSVCSKVVTPSVNGQNKLKSTENYHFKMSLGSQKDLVIIGVHFKNIFRGADQNMATVDGVWQISDNPIKVSPETEYDRMTISEVDAANGTITMNNIENSIFLTENGDYSLMPEFRLKTADENKFKENGHINFALFKEISLAGVYDIRSHIATGNSSWFSGNFSGFFYDIDEVFGTETIHINISNGNQLSGKAPYGARYTTTTHEKNFKFQRWGTYGEIGFLGKKYFNNYLKSPDANDDDEILLAESADRNSLARGQLEEILKDDRNDIVLESGKTLKLAEGYELVIESIDRDGKVSLKLNKDGSLKDLMIIAPSKDGANMADKTYYYVTDVGKLKGLAIIAVHFKKAIRVGGNSQAIVDGIWQISDKPYNVKLGAQYDRMSIAAIDPYRGIITMDNRNNTITLTRNKDISLMEGICLRTADNDTFRYHIYKPVTIGEEAILSKNIL
jgi:S-layer protein (TIGR01567 family)